VAGYALDQARQRSFRRCGDRIRADPSDHADHFFGSYEAANLVLAYMKLEDAAETAADLLAQTTVNTVISSFTGYTNAVQQVLSPLPTSGSQLKIAYASVTYSTGSPVIDWHYEYNGATALTIANITTNQNLANLGSETSGSTDSVIVVQLTYAYTSSSSHELSSAYTLSEIAYNRPRYTNCVATYLNTGSVCP
jgi:Flp pilus assembly protein TadG